MMGLSRVAIPPWLHFIKQFRRSRRVRSQEVYCIRKSESQARRILSHFMRFHLGEDQIRVSSGAGPTELPWLSARNKD